MDSVTGSANGGNFEGVIRIEEEKIRSRVRNGETRFYAHVDGQQVQLGSKKGEAERRLKELLNGQSRLSGPNPPVEELVDKFLA